VETAFSFGAEGGPGISDLAVAVGDLGIASLWAHGANAMAVRFVDRWRLYHKQEALSSTSLHFAQAAMKNALAGSRSARAYQARYEEIRSL
jgi:hypothetical protein